MNPRLPVCVGMAACVAALAAAPAAAQVISFTADATLDRWMYPFNGTPGVRMSASTFGIPRLPGFDDHDAQFIVGFRTDAEVPTGLAPAEYRITALRVSATTSNSAEFRYDPTYDAHNTYENQEGGYPGLIPDADLGRPIMIWGLGYRAGFTFENWTETSPFGFSPEVPPSQGARTAYIAVFDPAGQPSDASNHLKQGVDLTPMAVGQLDAVAPGAFVPADSTFHFDINPCDPGVRAYLRQGLAAGELRFGISSLHAAEGGPDGGSGETNYPIWYTRENPIAQIFGFVPRIELEVRVGSVADHNGDGVRDIFDLLGFIDDYTAGDLNADVDANCAIDVFDLLTFIDAFGAP